MHGEELVLSLAGVVGVEGVGFAGVRLDGVGGEERLAEREGAPVALTVEDPGPHAEADAIEVATVAGTQIEVIDRLRGEFEIGAIRQAGLRLRPKNDGTGQQSGHAGQRGDWTVFRSHSTSCA